MNLDLRDFIWWRRKAEVRNARKKAETLSMMRLSYWGDKDEFYSEIRDLQDRIDLLELREWSEAEVRQNWKACTQDLRSALARMRK